MQAVILDLEANGLLDTVTKIHCVVCKDVATKQTVVFKSRDELSVYLDRFDCVVGHNLLGYDLPVLSNIWGLPLNRHRIVDTLVLSRLVDFGREGGHSLEAWGEAFGLPKVGLSITDWSVWTQEMEDRCVSDVEINFRLFQKFLPYLNSERWKEPIETEHAIAVVCHDIHTNGFAFDLDKARELHDNVSRKVDELTENLRSAFPPRSRLIREYTPRATKFGTISKSSVPRGSDLTSYTIDAPFSTLEWVEFNPGSPKQIVERLNEAGWKPYEKTKGHKDAYRARDKEALEKFAEYGWSITEGNLSTLPPEAPEAAQTLTRWLILNSRKRKFEEWFEAYNPVTKRVHGTISPIGTWTHRMSHSDPNLGNIPTEKPQDTDEVATLNIDMRKCWIAGEGAYLVGVDADSIQLRILAHYMEDERFIQALVSGDKLLKTDVHSLNAKALGAPCKGRRDAKTFIYAWVLGAGIPQVANILGCTRAEAEEANENFLGYYPALAEIISEDVPREARRGYIEGIDRRYVKLSARRLETNPVGCVIGGYLQNGEAVAMKKANIIWRAQLEKERLLKFVKQVNYVHDEWQSEVYGDYDLALHVANVKSDSLREVGELYKLKCPLAGSILGGHDKIAIGKNWYETH